MGETPSWVRSYFANPPYGRKTKRNPTLVGVDKWLDKAIADRRRGVTAVYLLRVDSSTGWMHDKVFPYARPIWVRGRIKFLRPGGEVKPSPFASMVAAYEPGVSFPPQSVMWKDGRGIWHVLETTSR